MLKTLHNIGMSLQRRRAATGITAAILSLMSVACAVVVLCAAFVTGALAGSTSGGDCSGTSTDGSQHLDEGTSCGFRGQTCVGDCGASGGVHIADLITGVTIALGLQPVPTCPAFANQQGTVDVTQLIQGVNNALNGCRVSGPRFVDNGDGTIADNQTGLVWEKKDQGGGLHEVNNYYVWAGYCSDRSGFCQPNAAAATTCDAATEGGLGCAECAGTATCHIFRGATTTIWDWLSQLNAASFAGHSDWRIPTVGTDGDTAQLETIDDPSVSGCGVNAPCVPPAFDTRCTSGCTVTSCSCTQFVPDSWGLSSVYWSSTTDQGSPNDAWFAFFLDGTVGTDLKSDPNYVRAVRGGS